jgi:hypothetical protein
MGCVLSSAIYYIIASSLCGSEAQAHQQCGNDDRIYSHSVGHYTARTMIPRSRGHRAQEGWDPSL